MCFQPEKITAIISLFLTMLSGDERGAALSKSAEYQGSGDVFGSDLVAMDRPSNSQVTWYSNQEKVGKAVVGDAMLQGEPIVR